MAMKMRDAKRMRDARRNRTHEGKKGWGDLEKKEQDALTEAVRSAMRTATQAKDLNKELGQIANIHLKKPKGRGDSKQQLTGPL